MTAPWWDGPLVAFDLETTSPDPERARIVTAAVAVCSRGGIDARTWLADPGVPIPAGAQEVHGITTERAQAEGQSAEEVLAELVEHLAAATSDGAPLVAFNARYDLTVLARELARRGGTLGWLARVPVIDPRVLDTWLDRFRPSYVDPATGRKLTPEQGAAAGIPSSRTLEGMAAHYGATLDGAHNAAFDAIAAARLAWVIGSRGEVKRRVRHRGDAIERARLVREWDAVRGDLDALHAFQVREALAERVRFADYKRSIGEHDEAARIDAEKGWPVLEAQDCPEHGERAPCSVCDSLAAVDAEAMTS